MHISDITTEPLSFSTQESVNNLNSEQKLLQFINERTGLNCSLNEDITKKDISGHDFAEFMALFFKKFEIDSRKYLWYYHHTMAGLHVHNFEDLVIEHLPITPSLLLTAISKNQWPIIYPTYRKPKISSQYAKNRV